ncbi:MAG TPA: sulfotransferase family 2 domain-containing protein [Blastocatellia bacterium]|nr:sulfotransferase family 2 domain-containing protein [Blastocatellia bacterium]
MQQFFFLHIPKTAGMSFTSFLCDHFDPAETLVGEYWETIRKQPMDQLAKYKLITGHIGYELCFHLNNPFVIAIFRHPVDRLCSVYEYLNQVFDNDPKFSVEDPDINAFIQLWKVAVRRPLSEFLDSTEAPVIAALLRNPQSRQLAQSTPYLLSDLSDEQIFQLAQPRFDKIDVVGTVESFADTVAVTCRKAGWEMPADLDRHTKNITEKRSIRESLDPSLRQKIEKLAAVDLEIYHLAKKRLQDDLRQ